MIPEVFQAAYSNGYGFFVDSNETNPLTADLLKSKDRLVMHHINNIMIKLTGKDVLDMNILISIDIV
jgi:hypothetical protein